MILYDRIDVIGEVDDTEDHCSEREQNKQDKCPPFAGGNRSDGLSGFFDDWRCVKCHDV